MEKTTTAVSAPKEKFTVAIRGDTFQKLINNSLGDREDAKKFTADLCAVVGNNYQLQRCTHLSVITGGLTANSLGLSLSPSLGQCYLVPYCVKGYMQAQFQVGWKGFVQLALRTKQYEKLNAIPVHEGEFKKFDAFGEPIIEFDIDAQEKPIIGYCAGFKLTNGFTKFLYWTVEQCEKHGSRYSKAHQGDNKGKDNDRWTTDFDGMALKTVVKQLISKWGPMSIELEKAIQADQAVVQEDGTFDYVDNDPIDEIETSITNSLSSSED